MANTDGGKGDPMRRTPNAHLDETLTAVLIENLAVRDKDVAREAQRWTTGERGPVVDDPAVLAAADLAGFVNEAVKIGAHALSATGQSQDARALELMVKQVGEKAEHSTSKAAELTERAVKTASDTVAKAAEGAKKAIIEADAKSRKEITEAVVAAKNDLNAEVRRHFGGESPELLERLQPVLDKFGTNLDEKSRAVTAELLAQAVKQFDPSDPTSPIAKHTAELTSRQRELAELIGENHGQLSKKVDDLTVALKIQEARTSLAKITPIKGDSFENAVNAVLCEIAAGLGDEYVDTRATVGNVPRSKKGDGVLQVDDGTTRVVLEMTDSTRTGWIEYLDEAERNRLAGAALGVVRSAEQNGGQSIRVFGARRIVMAFDPESDDPALLRTVVMLMRTAALTALSRRGVAQMATAEEKITEAVTQLQRLDEVKKTAGAIQKSALKIETVCTGISSSIERLLNAALVALNEARTDTTDEGASDAVA
jgi:hypothetical protein